MEGCLSSLWSGRARTKQSTSKYLEILPEDFLYLCESSYFKDGSLLDFVSLWSICIILIHILKTSVSQCDNANRKHQRAHHLEGSCKKSKEEGAMLERRGIQLSLVSWTVLWKVWLVMKEFSVPFFSTVDFGLWLQAIWLQSNKIMCW